MKLLDIYKYIFFREYMWNLYLWDNKEMAAFNATLAITSSQLIYFYFIDVYIGETMFENYSSFIFQNIYLAFFLGAFILVCNFYLFEYNEKYLKIEEKFKDIKNNKRTWFTHGLLIFGVTLFPYVLILIN